MKFFTKGSYLKYLVGTDEMKTSKIYIDAFGELLATFLLVFVGIGAAVDWKVYTTFPMQCGFATGIVVSSSICIFGHTSGGLANPAVALSFISSGHISLMRGVVYMLAEFIGGILAAGLFKLALINNVDDTYTHYIPLVSNSTSIRIESSQYLGATHRNPEIHVGTAFGFEFVATCFYILTWQACWDPFRNETKPAAASIIGFTYTACHGFAKVFSGASMNPAKSFGPALILNIFQDHWIFWMGPFGAGLLGGLFYRIVLMANPEDLGLQNKKSDIFLE